MTGALRRARPCGTRQPRVPGRGLLACGVVGAPLFVVAFLVEGATRPGYDLVRVRVSSMALGPDG